MAKVECSLSERVDGKFHSWTWDGDDPNMICVYCGEVQRSGMVIKAGRGSSSVAVVEAMLKELLG